MKQKMPVSVQTAGYLVNGEAYLGVRDVFAFLREGKFDSIDSGLR